MAELTSSGWVSSVLPSISLGGFQGYDHRNCLNLAIISTVKTSGQAAFKLKDFNGSRRKHRNLKESLQIRKCSSSIAVRGLPDGEEDKWLREEKRWLREEERWLREESRWNTERKALVEQHEILKQEIVALNAKIVQLQNQIKSEEENDGSISDLIVSLTQLLQSLNAVSSVESGVPSTVAQIPPTSSSATDISILLDDVKLEYPKTPVDIKLEETKTPLIESPTLSPKRIETSVSVNSRISEIPNPSPTSLTRSKRILKRGSEGDDVKVMQEALEKLGFYSGEEDMEYSVFSTGTERAVQTWQASLGISEDGIMTSDLLGKLLGEDGDASKKAAPPSKDDTVKSPVEAQSIKVSFPAPKNQDSVVPLIQAQNLSVSGPKMPSPSPAKVNTFHESDRRVYLLGENRWEEPSRLNGKNGTVATISKLVLGENCYSCKGVGTMLCTECEGTGELNVEEQFLEWVEEGAKCPYCEGEGVLNCDVCDGKGIKTP